MPMQPLPLADGARCLSHTAGVRVLEDRVLRVTGDDARTWLNGQVTNDIGRPAPGRAVYALVLQLKGRILSDLWVLDRGEGLDLVVPATLSSDVAEHLDHFIIMEDVELDALDATRVVSVQGPAAAEVAARVRPEGWWDCPRLWNEGRDLLVPEGEVEALVGPLAKAASDVGGGLVGEASWELARVRAGVPRMGVDFGSSTYPQEAGLKERAVSFSKGCYQGQEAVVMLEHRGKPPKKLARLEVQADEAPSPGTAIVDESGRSVGEITSAVTDPESPGRCPALGHLKRDAPTDPGALRAGDAPVLVRAVLGG